MIKLLVGPFALLAGFMGLVLFRDKHAKDLYIVYGVGSVILAMVARL